MSFGIRGAMCEDLTSFEFLNVRSLDYLPYHPCLFIERVFFPVVCDWCGGWHTRLPLFSCSYFHPPMACSLPFQPLYILFLMEQDLFLIWADMHELHFGLRQSQSPAVRVAAFFFGVAEWTFSWACVQQALCVNSAFLLQQSSHHGKNFTSSGHNPFLHTEEGGRTWGTLHGWGHESWW